MSVVPFSPHGPRADIADRLALLGAELRGDCCQELASAMTKLSAAVRDGACLAQTEAEFDLLRRRVEDLAKQAPSSASVFRP